MEKNSSCDCSTEQRAKAHQDDVALIHKKYKDKKKDKYKLKNFLKKDDPAPQK